MEKKIPVTDGEIYLLLERETEAQPEKGFVPARFFQICRVSDDAVMGGCDLRLGHNRNTWYGGNIGYHIDPAFQGHHYAAKACRLLFQLAREEGMQALTITCKPENIPSRKTCLAAGGTLREIATLPKDHDLYADGQREVCIFLFSLDGNPPMLEPPVD